MSPRPTSRTQVCGPTHARTRLSQARAFLEVAELVGTEQHEVATPHVAAALAVLAGIAASDAACCATLATLSRPGPPPSPRPARPRRAQREIDGARRGSAAVDQG